MLLAVGAETMTGPRNTFTALFQDEHLGLDGGAEFADVDSSSTRLTACTADLACAGVVSGSAVQRECGETYVVRSMQKADHGMTTVMLEST